MIGDMIKLQPDYWRHLENQPSVVSIEEREAILRAAILPINRRNRAILNDGILCIRHDVASRSAVPKEVDLARSRDRLAWLWGELLKEMQTDAGRVVISGMKIPLGLVPMENLFELDVDRYIKDTVRLHNIAETQQRFSSAIKVHKRDKGHDVELQNWLFETLYNLFAELKDARPGNACPLYQFTIECAKLVGIKITITEDAFRMRIQRILNRHRKGIEFLANLQ
jgi:hypothetical protein